ncbi:MAG: hypothetical protein LBN25_04890 [Christensenellaceae bacterium]|jgi:hypothetical protein|nr:hypothetical protein [Christensenellaceae bacterium]
MSKNLIFKILFPLSLLAAAVIWLLAIPAVGVIKDFNPSWVGFGVAALWGLLFVLAGLFKKTFGLAKKTAIVIGVGLLLIAAFLIISIFAISDTVIIPIICIALALALVLSVLAVGGKKWDSGDNQKVGYKNYYQRKEEEEKKAGKE